MFGEWYLQSILDLISSTLPSLIRDHLDLSSRGCINTPNISILGGLMITPSCSWASQKCRVFSFGAWGCVWSGWPNRLFWEEGNTMVRIVSCTGKSSAKKLITWTMTVNGLLLRYLHTKNQRSLVLKFTVFSILEFVYITCGHIVLG